MAQQGVAREVQAKAGEVGQQVIEHPWFARLARFGYAAKGVVYLLAGGLTARAAFGLGGAATDKAGALQTILSEPFGTLALALIAIGLIGYVLLRAVQAIADPERKGSDAQGLALRAGYLFSAVLYAGLAFTALRLALGLSGDSGGNQVQDLVSRVFSWPLGRWLVGLGGLVVLGSGLFQLYKAYRADFSEHVVWNAMSAGERAWASRLGRVGLAARGVVQGLVGVFLLQAAWLYDVQKAQDSGGALQSLARPPFGVWTVGVVAAGLAAYGVYMLAAARYSRIVTQ